MGKGGEKTGKEREVHTCTYREETPPSPREQQQGKREWRGKKEREREGEKVRESERLIKISK